MRHTSGEYEGWVDRREIERQKSAARRSHFCDFYRLLETCRRAIDFVMLPVANGVELF